MSTYVTVRQQQGGAPAGVWVGYAQAHLPTYAWFEDVKVNAELSSFGQVSVYSTCGIAFHFHRI